MRKVGAGLRAAFGVLVLTGVVACGGSSDGSATGVSASASASPDDASGTASPTPTGDAASEPGDDATRTTDATDSTGALSAGPSEPVRVTYRISGAAAAATPEEIVLSYDPPRSAMIFRGGHVIDTGQGTVFCIEESGQPQCFELPTEMAGADNPFLAGLLGSFWVAQTDAAVQSEGSEIREIAGREAVCARLDPTVLEPASDATDIELCVDADTGVGLLYEVTDPDGGVTTIAALDFGAPSPEDFTPPVEPQPFPTGDPAP